MMQKKAVATILATLAIAPMMSNACTSMILPGTDGSRVYGGAMELGIPLHFAILKMPRGYAIQDRIG